MIESLKKYINEYGDFPQNERVLDEDQNTEELIDQNEELEEDQSYLALKITPNDLTYKYEPYQEETFDNDFNQGILS